LQRRLVEVVVEHRDGERVVEGIVKVCLWWFVDRLEEGHCIVLFVFVVAFVIMKVKSCGCRAQRRGF
jgi:hypothetical protein